MKSYFPREIQKNRSSFEMKYDVIEDAVREIQKVMQRRLRL